MTLNVTQLGAEGMAEGDGRIGQAIGMGRYLRPAVAAVEGPNLVWRLRPRREKVFGDESARLTPEDLRRRLLALDAISVERDSIALGAAAPIDPLDDLLFTADDYAGTLQRFVRLDLADTEQLVAFAKRWGVLAPSLRSREQHDGAGSEPRALWIALQHDLRALLAWRAAGRRGEPDLQLARIERSVQWLALRSAPKSPRLAGRVLRFDSRQFENGDVAALYVESMLAARRPVLSYEPDVGIVSRLTGLTSLLALQVGQALVGRGSDGKDRALTACAGCGCVFSAKRRPRADQAAWCGADGCMLKATQARQARARARKRSGVTPKS